jgi:hypothetical protein
MTALVSSKTLPVAMLDLLAAFFDRLLDLVEVFWGEQTFER